MRLASLYSTGKDSTYAAYWALKEGFDVEFLLSIISKNKESYMYHTPNIHLAKPLAENMNLPLVEKKTEGKKEDELKDLENALKELKNEKEIEGITTGAIASKYQYERIKKICDSLDLECFNPLWQANPVMYMQELLDKNFKVMIIGVYAHGLGEEWLGRVIDGEALDELIELNEKYGIHVAGEGGEFETLVLDCPLYGRELRILDAEKQWEKTNGKITVKDFEFIGKVGIRYCRKQE